MKRSPPLRLEHLEDRLTPTTLTVSFVPDGTQIGSEQSQLFRDMNPTASTASWQQGILGMLQNAASQYGITLQVVADDGASMNGSAPEDGQLRIAAVDQAFQTHGPGMMLPGGGDLIVESQVTFGVGLGLIGPDGGRRRSRRLTMFPRARWPRTRRRRRRFRSFCPSRRRSVTCIHAAADPASPAADPRIPTGRRRNGP